MVNISGLVANGLYLRNVTQNDVAAPEQQAIQQYSVLNFLGGAGPYMQFPGYGISTDIPSQCTLEQVQLIARHGERYPTTSKGEKYSKVISKLNKHGNLGKFQGSLEFLNNYAYFGDQDPQDYNDETTPSNSQGLFAGVSDSNRHGESFRAKYGSLYDSTQQLPLFTSSGQRVYDTAVAFAQGFLGGDLNSVTSGITFTVLSENSSMGANSLTPDLACSNYDKDANSSSVAAFSTTYLTNILNRLQSENPSLDFSSIDTDYIQDLFSLCAYELNVKSESSWCGLFTTEEYLHYQYHSDLAKYYEEGPGNNLSAAIGSDLLNASLTLLNEPSTTKIWLSFFHDTQFNMFLSALGLVNPKEDLPVDKIEFTRTWIQGHIVPMGARMTLERYSCGGTSYVRYILNEAVVPVEDCDSGPGFSCPLSNFNTYIQNKLNSFNYIEQCGVDPSYPQCLTFYWDYPNGGYPQSYG